MLNSTVVFQLNFSNNINFCASISRPNAKPLHVSCHAATTSGLTPRKMDERTTEILKRFTDSWSETEKFYDDLVDNYSGFGRLKPVRNFIRTLKQSGENKFFRLGTSVHLLIMSRSVEHGLREDQKRIIIDAYDDKFEVTLCDGNKIYRQYTVDSLSDKKVSKLIETLKDTLVG